MGTMPLARVVEGRRERTYLPIDPEETTKLAVQLHLILKDVDFLAGLPNQECRGTFASNAQGRRYGFNVFSDYFTPRQLVALTTFSDLVGEARQRVRHDAIAAGLPDDGRPLHEGGTGAQAYADAVATYLALAVDRLAMTGNSLVRWNSVGQKAQHAFGRQALPMLWDFAEPNFIADATGSISAAVILSAEPLDSIPMGRGQVRQGDATKIDSAPLSALISTDPPYYDNVGYADLSDFFYVWLRRTQGEVFPELFRTLLTPKVNELIASPYRHDGKKDIAQQFFEDGLGRAFEAMHRVQSPAYPMTVYYAFKQSEDGGDKKNGAATASTGWETMLEGLLASGFAITGTWPMRTEMGSRMIGQGTNALASSIVIVCRPREASAGLATRRDFTNALRHELPDALITLQHGNIAPVDLAQAAIGPGMAIFSRFAHVIEADGSPMRVRTALQLINQELDAYLEAQEGELDTESRFCVAWYDQYGLRPGPYGEADVLARAKGTAVNGMQRAGVLLAEAGKVRLLRRDELPAAWDPRTDTRLTVWEATQHLIRRFAEGEAAAGALLAALGPGVGEQARALAYRLFALCERRGRSEEAQAYNGLIVAWPQIQEAAASAAASRYQQERFGE